MCHGTEDPSQRAAESAAQRHPGEGLHRYNQGGAQAQDHKITCLLLTFVPRFELRLTHVTPCLASTRMRRGWRACPSSWTGTCGPSSAGSDSVATRRSPAPSPDSVRACKEKSLPSPRLHSIPECFSLLIMVSEFVEMSWRRPACGGQVIHHREQRTSYWLDCCHGYCYFIVWELT